MDASESEPEGGWLQLGSGEVSGLGTTLNEASRADREPASVRSFVGEFARRRWKVACAALVIVVAATLIGSQSADEGSVPSSLAAVLRPQGLELDPQSLLFLSEPKGPLIGRPAMFLAHGRKELPDLYYAEVRVAGASTVLGVSWLTDLTRTSSAAEQRPVRVGRHVLYASTVGGRVDAVVELDLHGEPAGVTAGWPARARLQNQITNLQETGRAAGFGRIRYAFDKPAEHVDVSVEGGRFIVRADGARLVIDPHRAKPVEGADRVDVEPMEKGEPGTLTWLVDTVRDLSFVGPKPIAWLEHQVYSAKDWATRAWFNVAGQTNAAETEAEVAEAYGYSVAETRRRLALTAPDPETGWPPPNLHPVLDKRVRGEGKWMALTDDPFVGAYPNAPAPFYQTFLRVDPDRLYERVYLVAFDPRQVQLRIMSGTEEPVSATGATAPGQVPRDPNVIGRLVGAFNGGFQAMHGEFGMMSDGKVYLPPKPWAATVAVFDDGQVAMGSWLPPPKKVTSYLEQWALEQIPDDMVEFRQNLTSVIEDGQYNPWQRWYWGAAPIDADEQTYIARSGLCLTREGFLIYFWGDSMGPKQLGDVMRAARCVRGMHLDMNTPHTGFEFYNIHRTENPFPPLGHPLNDAEWQGPVPRAPGFVARTRLLVRNMDPMRFPRYIQRDPRDFFYLTLKPVLPGPDLRATANPREGHFSTSGLPHDGWPRALARAFLGGKQGSRTWLVRIDPHAAMPLPVAKAVGVEVRPPKVPMSLPSARRNDRAAVCDGEQEEVAPADEPGAGAQSSQGAQSSAAGPPPTLAWLTRARTSSGPVALYAVRERVGWRYAVGRPPSNAVVVVRGVALEQAPAAGAAIGVDVDGFLVYGERQRGDPMPLIDRMQQGRVQHAIALPAGVRLAFEVHGQHVSPDAYERPMDERAALPFVADPRPAAGVLFPDVRPRPYHVWARMQDTRVRYFKNGEPRFKHYEDGGVDGSVDAQ